MYFPALVAGETNCRRDMICPHFYLHHEAQNRSGCDCIGATVMKRTLHYAGCIVRMSDQRLPNIAMSIAMSGEKRLEGKLRQGNPLKRLQHRYDMYDRVISSSEPRFMRHRRNTPHLAENADKFHVREIGPGMCDIIITTNHARK